MGARDNQCKTLLGDVHRLKALAEKLNKTRVEVISSFKNSLEYSDALTQAYFDGFEAFRCRATMVYLDVDFYKFEVDDDLQSYMGGEEKNEGIEPDDADSLAQSKEDVSEKPINVDSSAQLEAPVLNRTLLGNSAGVGGSLGDAGQTSAGVEGEKKGDITEVK